MNKFLKINYQNSVFYINLLKYNQVVLTKNINKLFILIQISNNELDFSEKIMFETENELYDFYNQFDRYIKYSGGETVFFEIDKSK